MSDKRIITQKTGDELAAAGTEDSSGILDQYWLSKRNGMNGEMWRSAAENGNVLVFANYNSVWRVQDNQLIDILRGLDENGNSAQIGGGYFDAVYGGFLFDMASGYIDKVCAGYDALQNEFLLYIRQDRVEGENDFSREATFAWSDTIKKWIGRYGFEFDKFTSIGNKTYGVKVEGTYEIGIGYALNGNPVESWVVPMMGDAVPKWFKEIKINSEYKPTGDVEFMEDGNGVAVASFPASLLQNRNGWWQHIPRKTANPRDLVQARRIFVKIFHNLEEDFRIVDVIITYNPLK